MSDSFNDARTSASENLPKNRELPRDASSRIHLRVDRLSTLCVHSHYQYPKMEGEINQRTPIDPEVRAHIYSLVSAVSIGSLYSIQCSINL